MAYVGYDLMHYALHHTDFRHTPYLVSPSRRSLGLCGAKPYLHPNALPYAHLAPPVSVSFDPGLMRVGRAGTPEIHASRPPLQGPHQCFWPHVTAVRSHLRYAAT